MDFRNLSTTPNQMDTVMQRRPSLSSLSSASGYSSSNYGGNPTPNPNTSNTNNNSSGNSNNNTHANNTPKLSTQRLTNNRNLQSLWINQPSIAPSNVVPWVEQQQQQTLDLLENTKTDNNDDASSSTINNNVNVNANANVHANVHAHTNPNVNPNTTATSISASTTSNTTSSINDTNDNAKKINVSMINNNNSNNNNNTGNSNIANMLPSVSNATTMNNSHSVNSTTNNTTNNEADDDELIPTAIVIKNIPFAIKKEQLLDVMTKLNLPLPYAFNYHFDNGVFRGLAFANFTSTDETSAVVNQLNGREIGGRKLRVEYKKMLPAQERERIEREKREKRGQLEEQHRSASNASLASLLSAASTTAATKNLSVAGTNPSHTTERMFLNLPFNNSLFNLPPVEINFNDLEVLELYTQLVLYRDDITKSTFELAISPVNLNISQRKIISILCNYLNLLELFDNGLVIIRRKPGYIAQCITQQSIIPNSQQVSGSTHPQQHQQQQHQQQQHPSHSSSMMNLHQLGGTLTVPTHPELLRSQSQSALPLPRLRQQTSTPIQQQNQQQLLSLSQAQIQAQSQQPQQQQSHVQPQYNFYNQQSIQSQPQSARPYSQSYNIYQQQQQQQALAQQQQQQQQQQQLQYQQGHQSQVSTPTLNSSSAAALLRSSSSRSFVDVRSTPPMSTFTQQQQPIASSIHDSPTPHHHLPIQQQQQQQNHYYSNNNQGFGSQPQTPLTNNADVNSRFQPFGQHSHLTSSFTSLSQTLPNNTNIDDFSNSIIDGNSISNKLNALGLGGNGNNASTTTTTTTTNSNHPATNSSGFDNSTSGSGIWGPK